MENKTELMQLRHPDYDRELTELVRSNLSPKAFREKLLDYHENDIAAALKSKDYDVIDGVVYKYLCRNNEPVIDYVDIESLDVIGIDDKEN